MSRRARWLLGAAATHACVVGASMLLGPERYYAPTGIVVTPLVAMLVRAQGATWLGLAAVNWLLRGGERRAVAAVLAGDLVVQVGATAAVVLARPALPRDAFVVDVGGHVLLALVFGAALARVATRSPGEPAP